MNTSFVCHIICFFLGEGEYSFMGVSVLMFSFSNASISAFISKLLSVDSSLRSLRFSSAFPLSRLEFSMVSSSCFDSEALLVNFL